VLEPPPVDLAASLRTKSRVLAVGSVAAAGAHCLLYPLWRGLLLLELELELVRDRLVEDFSWLTLMMVDFFVSPGITAGSTSLLSPVRSLCWLVGLLGYTGLLGPAPGIVDVVVVVEAPHVLGPGEEE